MVSAAEDELLEGTSGCMAREAEAPELAAAALARGAEPPKDPDANLRWRLRVLAVAERSPALRLLLRELCRKDPRCFFDGFLYAYDPRPDATPNVNPFILWDFQEAFLAALEESLHDGKDLLVEKSRDMGVTWCVLGWTLWHWLFDKAFKAHLGSRKAEFVDKRGDTSSHFGALRYLLRKLPAWLLPERFDWKCHDVNLRLLNPASGNAITGEATNPDFSRQGRYSVVFLDEFASVECDRDVWAATSESSDCRVLASTPKGIGNVFHQLRDGGHVRVQTLHWSLHPHKRNTSQAYLAQRIAEGLASPDNQNGVPPGCYRGNDGKIRSPWYDAKCADEPDPRVIAQELDIDYLGSGMAVLDLGKVQAVELAVRAEQVAGRRVLRFEYNGDLEVYRDPERGLSYLLGVDTAKGTGGDFSVVEIWCDETLEQVAEYRGQMPPDVLGPFAAELAGRYDDGCLVVENTGMGLATCYAARDAGCRNLYHHRDYRREEQAGPGELGLPTNAVTRPEMVRRLMEAVREMEPGRAGTLRPHSLRWLAECKTLEWSRAGRPEARAGYHDDLLLATMMVLYARPFVTSRRSSVPLPFAFGDKIICWQ